MESDSNLKAVTILLLGLIFSLQAGAESVTDIKEGEIDIPVSEEVGMSNFLEGFACRIKVAQVGRQIHITFGLVPTAQKGQIFSDEYQVDGNLKSNWKVLSKNWRDEPVEIEKKENRITILTRGLDENGIEVGSTLDTIDFDSDGLAFSAKREITEKIEGVEAAQPIASKEYRSYSCQNLAF